MKAYITEVVESNYKDEPQANRDGRPYPRTSAWVKMPWLATPKNPDPISAAPVPVFIGQQHKEGRLGWEPLKPGTRVVVVELEDRRYSPTGLAIIAYGPPNTDELYTDLRETVAYEQRVGNAGLDKWVEAVEDPVFGPNEDVGRTHLDGRGYGWQTRHPYPNDATRDEMLLTGPATTILDEHRTDESVVKRTMTIPGPTVTYTVTYDAVAGTYTLADDKGNSMVLDSVALTLALVAVNGISLAAKDVTVAAGSEGVAGSVAVTATDDVSVSAVDGVTIAGADVQLNGRLGFFDAAPIPKPVVTGSKTAPVLGGTVPALASLVNALAALGLITDSTT